MLNIARRGAWALLFLLACRTIHAGPTTAGQASATTSTVTFDTVKNAKCTFPVFATGLWVSGEPRAELKTPAKPIELQFDAIDVEGGTARALGAIIITAVPLDVTVQRLGKYLHFMQILRDGPLYTTTLVFDQQNRDGKVKAIHARHEFTEISVPGFPSKPEQYYGWCVIS